MNLVEKAGTGIKRMYEAMKSYRLEPLEIETDRDWFTIIFSRPVESYEERFYGATQKFGESSEKSSEKILAIIKENSYITARDMAERIGISQRAVEKHIANLKKKGVLKRVGPDRGGYWEVVEGVDKNADSNSTS